MNRTSSLFLALSLAGCFGSHGSDDGPTDDPRPIDAGPRPLDWGPGSYDIGPPPIDFGPGERDAGPTRCEPRRADVSCGTEPYPSDVAFELPVSIGGADECYCGELVGCTVSLRPGPDGSPESIDLSTELCQEDLLCGGCFPYVDGTCSMPPLPGGSYPVRINGEPAFDLYVEDGDFSGTERRCTRVAEADPLGCGPVGGTPRRIEADEICHPESIFTGTRATIRVVDGCASCNQLRGPCTVTLDETGFAPVLQVETTTTFTACDVDCPDVCTRMEHECVVPGTLAPETSYQVIVNGVSFGTSIEVGSFAGGEICAGATIGG